MPMIRISYSAGGEPKVCEHTGEKIVIGRSKSGTACDVNLSPDAKVSRPHAQIFWSDNQPWVEDLASKHGTRLNGSEIKGGGRFALREGDRLGIGDTSLLLDAVEPDSGETTSGSGHTHTSALQTTVAFGPTLDAQISTTFVPGGAASDAERWVALLYELPLQFAGETRLDGLLQKIVERLVAVIPGATRGALLLVVEEAGGLVLQAHLPVGEPSVSRSLAEKALTERKGFVWHASTADPGDSVAQMDIGTGMYAPLIWRQEALGVICVDKPGRDPVFTAEDLRLLLGVAQYAAMSVSHQRAVDALERQSELTKRLFCNRFAPALRQSLMRFAESGASLLTTRQSVVTILCADIRGFAQLTATLGPQRTGDLLNAYFPPLIEAIFANHGTIERFAGDAIFAVFGSPEPDPRQQENAVRAAAALPAAAQMVTQSRLAAHTATCDFGIGIETGVALHGFIGNADRLEFAVVGDPPNQASRCCGAAGKGEILITEAVHSHVWNKFKLERVEVPVKHEGKRFVYRLVHPRPTG